MVLGHAVPKACRSGPCAPRPSPRLKFPREAAWAVCASDATTNGWRGLMRHHERSHAQAGHGRADQSGQGDRVVVELLEHPDLADTHGEGAASLIDDVVDGVDRRRAPMKNYSGGHAGDNPPGRRRYSLSLTVPASSGSPWLRVTRQRSRSSATSSTIKSMRWVSGQAPLGHPHTTLREPHSAHNASN